MNTGNGEKGILTHYPCKCTLIDSEKSVCVKGFEMGYRKKAASLSKQFYKSMKGKHTMKRDGEPDDFDLKKQKEINKYYPAYEGENDCIIDEYLYKNYIQYKYYALLFSLILLLI